jgi:hypothetical protein
VVAERMREDYQARVQARVQARLERGTRRDAADGAEPRAVTPRVVEPTAEVSGRKSQSLGDIQKESVENWVRLRRSQGYNPGQSEGQGQNTKDIQRESAQSWLRHRGSPSQKQDHAESAPAVKTGRVRDDDLAL